MNFLAHLTLSCEDPELQMGNLLGDFTKGKPPEHYPKGIVEGLRVHRLIDKTTDAHPAVKQLNKQLSERHGRYAGVVSDVVFDLYLYRHWAQFGVGDFDQFADRTYQSIAQFLPIIDDKIALHFHNMITHKFMNSYRSVDGILSVFNRMHKRLSKPEMLQGMRETMIEMDQAFDETFLILFPDLIRVVNEACEC